MKENDSSSASIPSMDTIVSLCKRRGFIFPSSEIYNSISGFFDYGHLGVELKNNIKRVWWQEMVYKRADMIGMESSIISSPSVWRASGHIDQFSDPFVDCKESKMRFRADQVHWAAVETEETEGGNRSRLLGYVCIAEAHMDEAHKPKGKGSKTSADGLDPVAQAAARAAQKLLSRHTSSGTTCSLRALQLRDLTQAPLSLLPLLPSPVTGTSGTLTPPRQFNLMFQTSVGAVLPRGDTIDDTDKDEARAYLRPETAQGIFTNFQNMQRASRLKVS